MCVGGLSCACVQGWSGERAKKGTTIHGSESQSKVERAETPRRSHKCGREGVRDRGRTYLLRRQRRGGGREREGGKTENEGRKEGTEDIPGDDAEDVGARGGERPKSSEVVVLASLTVLVLRLLANHHRSGGGVRTNLCPGLERECRDTNLRRGGERRRPAVGQRQVHRQAIHALAQLRQRPI